MNVTQQSTKKNFLSIPLLAGITYSLIWLAVGALLLSFLLHFSSFQESSLSNFSYVVHSFCALVGGLTASKRAGKRGWYYGVMLGITYGIIIALVAFLASNISLSWDSLKLLLTVMAVGALGGMIGVHFKK